LLAGQAQQWEFYSDVQYADDICKRNNPAIWWPSSNTTKDVPEKYEYDIPSDDTPLNDYYYNYEYNEHLFNYASGEDDIYDYDHLNVNDINDIKANLKIADVPNIPNSRYISTSQLIAQADYMIQFKIVVGCGITDQCSVHKVVRLEYNTDPSVDRWHLLQQDCTEQHASIEQPCRLHHYHDSSAYQAGVYSNWTRVTMHLPHYAQSSQTRFRWIESGAGSSLSWALDDVYIGEVCPGLCHGRGDCKQGACICDTGTFGSDCKPVSLHLSSHMRETFDSELSVTTWYEVLGGSITSGSPDDGCGSLLPAAHGKSLYFNGCGLRHAVTVEMDTRRASAILYVLQIGSLSQTARCNVNTSQHDNSVLLVYSTNKGISWHLLAEHSAVDFLSSARVSHVLPPAARQAGVQFRWWQLQHGGQGRDQWAIDHVQIVMNRQEQLLRSARRQHQQGAAMHRRRHNRRQG